MILGGFSALVLSCNVMRSIVLAFLSLVGGRQARLQREAYCDEVVGSVSLPPSKGVGVDRESTLGTILCRAHGLLSFLAQG
jgi:hypothetical protein